MEQMTNRELEQKIQHAFQASTPDVLDPILNACDKQKGTVIPMKKNENKKRSPWVGRITGIAAALVLVAGTAIGWGVYRQNYQVMSTVSLDVNPSIEITVNRKDRVIDVDALNEDGKKILSGMDLDGNDVDVAVNAIIGSMLRQGYLSADANSILVSVDSKDTNTANQLEQLLMEKVDTLLDSKEFDGATIFQKVDRNDELNALAKKHNISVGKAKLIQRIIAQNTRYTFEDLVGLTINELNLLTESGSLHLNDVNASGTASDKGYIGTAAAKQAALEHAGVAEADILNFEIDMDLEKGVMVYEIEFETADYEFEYDIDAKTGKVIWNEKEADRDDDGKPTAPNPDTPSVPSPALIGKDAAKQAAAKHAGIAVNSIQYFECELDRDNGKNIYEMEFISGSYEYDYDVDAETGAILKYEKERKDNHGANQQAPANAPISQEDAQNAAFAHASVKAADVRDLECELERDHGTLAYEIDFSAGGYEYEYRIDANTGSILRFHKERDDDYRDDTPSSGTDTYIGKDAAKAAALEHTGVSTDAIRDYSCELDTENGKAVYEIDFKSGNVEYEYEIDAITGTILHSEKEVDD